MMQTYYVSTPIYYVNDKPHVGHAYTTIAADVLARHNRLSGRDVLFLTGVDEHGQKVEQAANERGITPAALADSVVDDYRSLWPSLEISNDDFVRTSEERHKKAVCEMWRRLDAAGAIYKGFYEDLYCVPCETYWTATQLKDAGHADDKRCPDCDRPVQQVKEESYFFRLGNYQEALLKHIHDNPDFIGPESRRNEVLRFVEGGLRDLSVSRTTFSWGIPVPGDEAHVIYVWIDALTNYLTGAGFPDGDMKYWPCDVHLIGKDILRFHAVYWPCMLLAAGIPLPKRVYAHGWWTVEGEKMSKSKGNALQPSKLLEEFDADTIRYFMLREVPFGHDGDFSFAALKNRYNTELANDFGNLLNRSLSMLHKYQDGVLTAPGSEEAMDRELVAAIEGMQLGVEEAMGRQAFHEALEHIHAVVRHGNRYVEDNAPWALFKQGETERLATVLYHLVESLRLIMLQLSPFMPVKSATMLSQILNEEVNIEALSLASHGGWGLLSAGHACARPVPVFPRLE